MCHRIQKAGAGSQDPPEKSQNICLSRNTGPDHLKSHKSTKPAFNVVSSSSRQQMAFRWRAVYGPLIVAFGSSLPSSTKKSVVKVGLPLTKLSGSAHVWRLVCRKPQMTKHVMFSHDMTYICNINSIFFCC